MNNNNLTNYFKDENKPKAQKHRVKNNPDINADFVLAVYFEQKAWKWCKIELKYIFTNLQTFYLSYQDCQEEPDIFKNVQRVFSKLTSRIKKAFLYYNLNCGNRVNTYYTSRGEASPQVQNLLICTYNPNGQEQRIMLNQIEMNRLPRFDKVKVTETSLQKYFNDLMKSQSLIKINELQANAVINYMRMNYAKHLEAVEISEQKSISMDFTSKSEITKYFMDLIEREKIMDKNRLQILREQWQIEVSKLEFLISLNQTAPQAQPEASQPSPQIKIQTEPKEALPKETKPILEDWEINTILRNHKEEMTIEEINARTRISLKNIKKVIEQHEKNEPQPTPEAKAQEPKEQPKETTKENEYSKVLKDFHSNKKKLENLPQPKERQENLKTPGKILADMQNLFETLSPAEQTEYKKVIEKYKKENNL